MRDWLRRKFRSPSRLPAQTEATSTPPKSPRLHPPAVSVQDTSVQDSSVGKGGLWKDALDRLSQSDRETVLKYSPSPDSNIDGVPDQLLQAAQKKRTLCDEKRWRFTLNGHTMDLKDTADKVVQWLEKAKTIGDTAANADPIHAGLPWAGIKVLLMVGVALQSAQSQRPMPGDRVVLSRRISRRRRHRPDARHPRDHDR